MDACALLLRQTGFSPPTYANTTWVTKVAKGRAGPGWLMRFIAKRLIVYREARLEGFTVSMCWLVLFPSAFCSS